MPGTELESGTRSIIEMIVPDNVARVTLHYPPGPANGYQHKVLPAFTITTKPVNNLVLAEIPRGGGGTVIRDATIVWRAANGTIIKR